MSVLALPLRRAGERHPEAWAAAGAGGAWLLLLLPWAAGSAQAFHDAAHRTAPVAAEAVGWLVMTAAMMIPAALAITRHLALTALWRRRRRTTALFLASYLTVWATFGGAVLPLVAWTDLETSALLPSVLLAAAAWELTREKWRAVRACRLVDPLPPSGPAADRACCRAGLWYGRRCVVACWPAMLAMAVAGHAAIGLMALLGLIIATEKRAAEPSRLAPYGAGLLAATAVITAIVPAS